MAASSEEKIKARIPSISGTKPSLKNAQLLISTGIPSLDNLLGGGLPIGSILLIEEDTYGHYGKVMLKYFLAEGAVVSHSLFLASQDVKPDELISELPAVVTPDTTTFPEPLISDEKMRIAWRYQNMKIHDSSLPKAQQSFGHFYDLTKRMDKDRLDKSNIALWNGENSISKSNNNNYFHNNAYGDLLKTVQKRLAVGEFLVNASPKERNILRVGIQSLGSRLWCSDTEELSHNDLLKFLYSFRALLRNSFAVAFITVPSKIFHNHDDILGRIEHLTDTAIWLESFAGSPKETNQVYRDYHGLLHIKKLPAINTMAAHCPESFDLAFKMRKKKFLIEVLHLPPELSDSTQREQDEMTYNSANCNRISKSALDF